MNYISSSSIHFGVHFLFLHLHRIPYELETMKMNGHAADANPADENPADVNPAEVNL